MTSARLVCVDYAQIEARVLAWLAQEDGLLHDFASGADVYSIFGTKYLYNRPIDRSTPTERDISKMAVLGCGYGMSGRTFFNQATARGLRITLEESEKAVQAYRRAYLRIGAFWFAMQQGCDILEGTGGPAMLFGLEVRPPAKRFNRYASSVRLRSGRKIFYFKTINGLLNCNNKPIHLWYGLLTENIVQATARDIIRDAIVRLMNKVRAGDYPPELIPVTMTHDDLVFRLRRGTEDDLVPEICETMKERSEWHKDLPLDVSVKIGDTYYDIK